MQNKYEVVQIDQTEVTVDVSMLLKTEEMFFNATDIAKAFDRKTKDFLRLEATKKYIEEVFKGADSPLKNFEDIVKVRKGRYGGTWFHNELAFEFAGWCSPVFRRNLHKWAEQKMRSALVEAEKWERKRLESKTGFLPMTKAIMHNHENPQSYHFSNEADMINRIVLGMTAKQYKERYGVDQVRDGVTGAELEQLEHLQRINTGLIEIGINFQDRKEHLGRCHIRQLELYGRAA